MNQLSGGKNSGVLLVLALVIGQSAEGTYIGNCTFENNTAACGSAIYFNGAVDMYNSSKVFRTATIENCIFNSNVPTDVVGGCVFVYKYNVTVINCSLSNSGRGSTTYGFGGGIGDTQVLLTDELQKNSFGREVTAVLKDITGGISISESSAA